VTTAVQWIRGKRGKLEKHGVPFEKPEYFRRERLLRIDEDILSEDRFVSVSALGCGCSSCAIATGRMMKDSLNLGTQGDSSSEAIRAPEMR